jgi:hypothetical protein
MHHKIDYLPLPSDAKEKKTKTTRKREEKKHGMPSALCECSFSLSNYVSLLYLPFIFFSSLSLSRSLSSFVDGQMFA